MVVVHDTAPSAPASLPRLRRRDQNARRILEKALELIEEGGLEALSVQKLAAAVDYTPGALYRYYDSKAAILAQLVLRILQELRAFLDRATELLPEDASPLLRVLVLTRAYRAFARLEPTRFGLLMATLADPRVLLERTTDADPVALEMMAGLQSLATALDGAAREGALTKGTTHDRTLCLFAMLQGVSLFQKQARYAPETLDVERLATSGTRALLLGWGAEPKEIDRAERRLGKLDPLRTHFGGHAA